MGLGDAADTHGWAFGPFHLLPMQKLLLEGDAPVRLGSRALDILTILVERAGEVVTKEELITRVWPATFVDHANLRVHIAALRKLLGDGRGGDRCIVNIAARGYCFVAPVSRPPAPAAPPAARTASDQTSSLPVPLTRVIGRGGIVATVVEQVAELRLVTLVGPVSTFSKPVRALRGRPTVPNDTPTGRPPATASGLVPRISATVPPRTT